MPTTRPQGVYPFALAAAAVLTLTAPASANAGAALGLAALGHLLIGCAILGVIEGLLISRYLDAPRRRAILLLIAANYLSAWIGWEAMISLRVTLREYVFTGPALFVAHKVLLVLIPAALVLTVIVEYPLALLATRRPRRPRRVLLGVVGVHLITYPLLALWYSMVSSTSLYTRTTHDHTLSFVPADLDAWVYYIDPDDGGVWRIRPTGRDRERIADAGPIDPDDAIFAWTTPEGRHDLRGPGPDRYTGINLVENFAAHAAVHPLQIDPDDFFNFPKERGRALDLRPENDRAWQVRTTWKAHEGLKARNEKTGESYTVAFENPLFPNQFHAKSATILPGDLVVYQLGRPYPDGSESVIVVLDLNTRTLGLLDRGRCPVVGLGTPQGDE